MKKIDIQLKEKKYSVFIGKNSFAAIEDWMIKQKMPDKLLAVVDRNVLRLHSKKISPLLKSKKFSVELFEIDASEKKKNLKTVERIYSALQKGNYGRDTGLIAIGGGITGDIAAFAASTYMRGIKFAQVPTTLLSAADSSVGGKTGVNFNNVKNFIGTFYQPEFVLIDTEFFDTLPYDEMLCGLGEIVKTSFLAGGKMYSSLFDSLDKILGNDQSGIEKLLFESVNFKAGVVSLDEKEMGLRKVLNFGHTFAHALETVSDFKIKHGQAVLYGIVCALFLSHKTGLMNKNDFEEGIFSLSHIKNMISIPPVKPEMLYSAMTADKKNRNGKIKFVLIKSVGEIFVDVEADKTAVLSAIKFARDYFHISPAL